MPRMRVYLPPVDQLGPSRKGGLHRHGHAAHRLHGDREFLLWSRVSKLKTGADRSFEFCLACRCLPAHDRTNIHMTTTFFMTSTATNLILYPRRIRVRFPSGSAERRLCGRHRHSSAMSTGSVLPSTRRYVAMRHQQTPSRFGRRRLIDLVCILAILVLEGQITTTKKCER